MKRGRSDSHLPDARCASARAAPRGRRGRGLRIAGLVPSTACGARPGPATVIALSLLLLVLAAVASCCLGAYAIPSHTLWRALDPMREPVDPAGMQARAILVDIRIPRVVLGMMCGACLSAAGSALQALFRNPLADAGLTGIASGAALGATACIVLGAPTLGLRWIEAPATLPLAAFVGAMATAMLVYRLALAGGSLALPMLLLAGIAINTLVGAAIGLLTYVADDAQLRSLTFWSLGSLAGGQWSMLATILPLVAVGLLVLLRVRDALDAMQLGEVEALGLGVPVASVKRQVLLGVSLSVGAIVSSTGIVGFIGLLAPHCARLLCGPAQRLSMPLAMLWGATLTVLADLAARMLAPPSEIPLGTLTGLLGAPFFLAMLWRRRRQFAAACAS